MFELPKANHPILAEGGYLSNKCQNVTMKLCQISQNILLHGS